MTRRGWCPSLYEPMETGDGLLVRVKPPSGALPAQAAMVLAAAATRFGNGIVNLTNRANLQFRGMTPETARAFADIVAGLGLASTNPLSERRRSVIISPLTGIDPTVDPATSAVAQAIEAMLVADATLSALPGKFGLAIDGGGALPLHDAQADILVQPNGNTVRLALDGNPMAAQVPLTEAASATRALIGAFLQHPNARRMRDLDPHAVFHTAGMTPDTRSLVRPRGPVVGDLAPAGAFGIGLAFGQIDAPTLHHIASLAQNHGDATLRATPWRTLLLPGVSADSAHNLPASLITDPTDPRLTIDSCPGMPSCARATVATLQDAALLAKSAAGRAIHVSGCQKGCAHRLPRAITLVGEAGRYNLIRHGNAAAEPALRGLTITDIAALFAAEGLA